MAILTLARLVTSPWCPLIAVCGWGEGATGEAADPASTISMPNLARAALDSSDRRTATNGLRGAS
eukprot:5428541-Amphidinium_carterae.1